MVQRLAHELAPPGIDIQLFRDYENGRGYVVEQLRIDKRFHHVGGIIDVDPDFELQDEDPLVRRRKVAAFVLRAVGVDKHDINDIQGTRSEYQENLSRPACVALGADRVGDAALAQGVAAAFRLELFQPQIDTLEVFDTPPNRVITLTDRFVDFREQLNIDFEEYLHDLQQPSSVELSPKIERLWRHKGYWFRHNLGVGSRAELMMQEQLEQLRLSGIGHGAAKDQAKIITTTASKM